MADKDHATLLPSSSSDGSETAASPQKGGKRSSTGGPPIPPAVEALRDEGGYWNPLADKPDRRRSSQLVEDFMESLKREKGSDVEDGGDGREDESLGGRKSAVSFELGVPEGGEEKSKKRESTRSKPEDSDGNSDDEPNGGALDVAVSNHRSEDVKHSRRHRGSGAGSDVNISRRKGLPDPIRSLYGASTLDHAPHDIFVELDELVLVNHEYEWKETARWIKYEENLEEGSDKWGPPHMSTLSFHSLLNLRKCLEQGVVLLDLDLDDFKSIVERVVEQMLISDQLVPEQTRTIRNALLLRHHHVDDHEGFFRIRRNGVSSASLHTMADHSGRHYKKTPSVTNLDIGHSNGGTNGGVISSNPIGAASTPNMLHLENSRNGKAGPLDAVQVDVPAPSDDVRSPTTLRRVPSHGILRKIPSNSESTSILVGEIEALNQACVAFVRLARGVILPDLCEVPVPTRFIFILLGPSSCDLDFHEIGRALGTLMSNQDFHAVAYQTMVRRDILFAINEFLDDSIVLPPGDWSRKSLLPFEDLQEKSKGIQMRKRRQQEADEKFKKDEESKALAAAGKKPPEPPANPLERTGRPFGGLIRDIKQRFPWYLSDITDALNSVCMAATVFIYFAALSGAITFGGLYGDKTRNMIGVSETLIATALAGGVFSLLAGQPLIIVGATGPVLLFDEAFFRFCESNDINFLGMRVWVGIWLAIIGILVVMFEAAFVVSIMTRFTEEIFASLISLLFIFESFYKLYRIYGNHPLLADYCFTSDSSLMDYLRETNATETFFENLNQSTSLQPAVPTLTAILSSTLKNEDLPKNQPNTALMSTILMLGTFFIAYFLRHFRNSKFLGRSLRRALGDFGVPIAIIVMVVIDEIIDDTYTEKLSVPEGLTPSDPEARGWIISPFGTADLPVSIGMMFAAAVPALLVFILIFMETEICESIINKKCKKGLGGHHLDILLLCIINALVTFMGAPWMPAATVRSVSHVSALTVFTTNQAPGEKATVAEIKEQRLTSFLVYLLVGVSVLMAPLLRKVPIAVLFGVFLYMGVSSTNGIQFFERFALLLKPSKHHPRVDYVRRVRTWKMHLYTLIQVGCLSLLWVVKSTDAALAFPFFLILMIPIRKLLERVFSQRELAALDAKEGQQVAEEDEPDFYVEAKIL